MLDHDGTPLESLGICKCGAEVILHHGHKVCTLCGMDPAFIIPLPFQVPPATRHAFTIRKASR